MLEPFSIVAVFPVVRHPLFDPSTSCTRRVSCSVHCRPTACSMYVRIILLILLLRPLCVELTFRWCDKLHIFAVHCALLFSASTASVNGKIGKDLCRTTIARKCGITTDKYARKANKSEPIEQRTGNSTEAECSSNKINYGQIRHFEGAASNSPESVLESVNSTFWYIQYVRYLLAGNCAKRWSSVNS